MPGLRSLAKVIREDLPAVVQAITSPYSSGVNEGRITDVKLQETHGRPGKVPHFYASESYSSLTYAGAAPQLNNDLSPRKILPEPQ